MVQMFDEHLSNNVNFVCADSEGGEQEAEGAILTQAEGDRRREPQPPQRAHALSRYCSCSWSRDE